MTKEKEEVKKDTGGKKYEFTGVTITHKGVVLHQIRALKDFVYIRGEDKIITTGDRLPEKMFRTYVHKGEIGGYIQAESNLSQKGCCWVGNDSKVYGNAKVSHNAQICNDAEVYGNAMVYGNALIQNQCSIYGDARIYDYANIKDNANVYGNARVYDTSVVRNKASVCGNVRIYGNSEIWGSVYISKDYVIDSKKIDKISQLEEK